MTHLYDLCQTQYNYSKTCLKRPLKTDNTKILMTNGSLMKVESIAECSPWSILQYFDLHKAIIGLENQFVVYFGVAVLDSLYCIEKVQSGIVFDSGIVI